MQINRSTYSVFIWVTGIPRKLNFLPLIADPTIVNNIVIQTLC